jgi:hypothetical protein
MAAMNANDFRKMTFGMHVKGEQYAELKIKNKLTLTEKFKTETIQDKVSIALGTNNKNYKIVTAYWFSPVVKDKSGNISTEWRDFNILERKTTHDFIGNNLDIAAIGEIKKSANILEYPNKSTKMSLQNIKTRYDAVWINWDKYMESLTHADYDINTLIVFDIDAVFGNPLTKLKMGFPDSITNIHSPYSEYAGGKRSDLSTKSVKELRSIVKKNGLIIVKRDGTQYTKAELIAKLKRNKIKS